MKKKVSVIIPVYNQEKLIERCVRSVPKRDDIEIIIVDDGSTDKTPNLIEVLVNTYPDYVGGVICKTNAGVSSARNIGIEKARGEFLLFLDSDDYVEADKMCKIIDKFLPGDWDMVFYDMITNNKQIYRSVRENRHTRYGMFKFIRKSFIGDTRFPLGKQYAEDRLFHQELMAKKPKWVCTDILMYHYNYPRKGSLCDIHDNESVGDKK